MLDVRVLFPSSTSLTFPLFPAKKRQENDSPIYGIKVYIINLEINIHEMKIFKIPSWSAVPSTPQSAGCTSKACVFCLKAEAAGLSRGFLN